jgi:hypothetical protein
MAKERSRADAHSIKQKDPDRGPPMMEGAHHWDKGYDSDSDVFDRNESYPADHERGNSYVKLNKEMVSRDSKKLNRSKFTKIA